MKINRFEFDEKPESGQFERVETKKGLVEVGVSPYAETKQLDAVCGMPPDDGARATISSPED